jgi:DNA-binding transcriptional LysR family regulator
MHFRGAALANAHSGMHRKSAFLMNTNIRAPSTMSLLCLEASARLRSFTAAAHELRLTQGAVSRQVQTLEDRLGVRLFTRRREALALTEAGTYYLGEVAPLLRRLERATATVMALKGRGGELSLSVGASVGSYWLIPRLPAFTRAHGEITLNLGTRVGQVDFRTTPVDASLEFSDGQRAGLHSEFVLPLVLSPYASPSWVKVHGKTVDAGTPRSALIHHHTLPDGWDEWFRREGIADAAPREGPRYEIMSMALNAAVAGMGVALLPPYMGEDMVASGRLKRLSRHAHRYAKGYYLVYPEESARMQSLQVFKAWLLAQAGA